MNAFALLWIKQAMFFLLEVAVGKLICVSNEYFALYKTMLFVEYHWLPNGIATISCKALDALDLQSGSCAI